MNLCCPDFVFVQHATDYELQGNIIDNFNTIYSY